MNGNRFYYPLSLLYFILINLSVLGQKNAKELLVNHYQFDGSYFDSGKSSISVGNQIEPLFVLEDPKGDFKIEDLISSNDQIKWFASQEVTINPESVYWIKTQLKGSSTFSGQHILHLANKLGNDVGTYNHQDTYLIKSNLEGGYFTEIQKSGEYVYLNNRPIRFWVSLIKFDIRPDEVLDVFIRLEGSDPYHPMDAFNLWHLDPLVIGNNLSYAKRAGLFFGVLLIQGLFFLFLYFIEKDRIHLYYSLLVFGCLLNRGFQSYEFISYVPFPMLFDYYDTFFFIGLFVTEISGLLFTKKYIGHDNSSFLTGKLLPVFYVLCFFVMLLNIFMPFGIGYHWFYNGLSDICALLTPTLGFILVLTGDKSRNNFKKFYMLSFGPLMLGITILVLYDMGLILQHLNASQVDDFLRLSIIFMLVSLALIIGYRTNLLKREKEQALAQHALDQKVILEEQLNIQHLKDVNDLKNQLFTNISHEFRTPLTVIMGINDQMKKNADSLNLDLNLSLKFKNAFGLIQRNSNNLLNLVNQLLDLSKVDSGLMKLNRVQKDIIPYLNYLTESFFSKANSKKIRMVFYPEIKSLMMDFDEIKIQQLVYNLLDNALKFTDEGGKVVLHVNKFLEGDQAFLRMKFSDTGKGIEAAQLPHVFDRFYQADATSTRRGEGTGIGLSLCKELVMLMEGSISVESTIGEGTIFSIQIPISNNAKLQEDSTAVKSKPNSFYDSKTDEIASLNQQEHLADELPLLLIVEDNKDVIVFLKEILEGKYKVIHAVNGKDGIEKAFQKIPDIIITDLMMPEMNGIELTKVLKMDKRTSHIPIILLTAKASRGDRITGLKAGADAYLVKPFIKEELFVRLEQLLNLRKKLQEQFSLNLEKSRYFTKMSALEEMGLSIDQIFLEKLKIYCLEHLNRPDLNTENLSKSVGLSKSQFYRKLRALTNQTPVVFIRSIRLQKAYEMLKATELPISTIAYETGFNDPAYFTKSFRKHFGKSPTVFRK